MNGCSLFSHAWVMSNEVARLKTFGVGQFLGQCVLVLIEFLFDQQQFTLQLGLQCSSFGAPSKLGIRFASLFELFHQCLHVSSSIIRNIRTCITEQWRLGGVDVTFDLCQLGFSRLTFATELLGSLRQWNRERSRESGCNDEEKMTTDTKEAKRGLWTEVKHTD